MCPFASVDMVMVDRWDPVRGPLGAVVPTMTVATGRLPREQGLDEPLYAQLYRMVLLLYKGKYWTIRVAYA